MCMGYYIEYSRKGERKESCALKIRKAVCSKDKLIEMMASEKYIVWNAYFCDLDEYLLNHSDIAIERKQE